jgi:hypothetical protein
MSIQEVRDAVIKEMAFYAQKKADKKKQSNISCMKR